MNKTYGKIENGEFIAANPVREELPNGRGFIVKYLSDEDAASGQYKEVLISGTLPPNADAMFKAGRIKLYHKDIGNYIVRSLTPFEE